MYVRSYLQGSENGRVVTIGLIRVLQYTCYIWHTQRMSNIRLGVCGRGKGKWIRKQGGGAQDYYISPTVLRVDHI
jgi:hypothetical protein